MQKKNHTIQKFCSLTWEGVWRATSSSRSIQHWSSLN